MLSRNSNTQSGFTIIEVIIVMAIAGMIMLLVFQVIPTLMRNGRNSQRRADVATILEAVSHYELNNGGNLPSNSDLPSLLSNGDKLTFYTTSDPNNITFPALDRSLVNETEGPMTDTDKVKIYNYQKCDNTSKGKSKFQGAGFNDVVALYAIETSDGSAGECQQL